MTRSNLSSLFENAVVSIRMGIEDYAVDTPERALSAVRNFYAGILLLGKELLARAAPGADPAGIIGARYKPVPDGRGGVDYRSDGPQTIDFVTLGRRFKDFGVPIETKELEPLNRLRNAIEHRFAEEPASAVREAIARAFPITAAMFHQAREHPADLLGEAWATMLEVRELYETERARCRGTMTRVAWVSATVAAEHLRCVDCASDLLEQLDPTNTLQSELDLVCRNCGGVPAVEETIVDAVARALSGMAFVRASDTGETGPIFDCPVCDNNAYIDFEAACAVCGETFHYPDQCVCCHEGISLDDALAGFAGGLCTRCTYLMEKDD